MQLSVSELATTGAVAACITQFVVIFRLSGGPRPSPRHERWLAMKAQHAAEKEAMRPNRHGMISNHSLPARSVITPR